MCGEQLRLEAAHGLAVGSPPRVRGTDGGSDQARRLPGITPACAGNRAWLAGWSCRTRDHPRVCGEQLRAVPGSRWDPGSPPRVRGTAFPHLMHGLFSRITPACAGNSVEKLVVGCWGEDHPRVCGEQASTIRSCPFAIGSPPRVRGTVVGNFKSHIRLRITPACAGNRQSAWSTRKTI